MPPLPIPPALTEGRHTAEGILSERPNFESVEQEIALSGQNLRAMEVVGRVTIAGVGGVVAALTGAGNGTLSNIIAGPDVEVGAYLVDCVQAVAHGGVWQITTPSGKRLPDLTMTPGAGGTTRYTSRHLSFDIVDGGTDYDQTSLWTLTVSTTAPLVLGGTGTGTISAIVLGRFAQIGTYRYICREAIADGGRFEIIAPDGQSLGDNFLLTAGAGNATVIQTDHLTATITDAANFIVNNEFRVVVFRPVGRPKIVAFDPSPATYDGRQVAYGLLHRAVDASAGDAPCVVYVRGVQFTKDYAQFLASVPAGEQATAFEQLAAADIIAR